MVGMKGPLGLNAILRISILLEETPNLCILQDDNSFCNFFCQKVFLNGWRPVILRAR